MAGAREENASLLDGTQRLRDDLEHCPPAAASATARVADSRGARRALLCLLAATASGAVLLCASSAVPRSSPRRGPAALGGVDSFLIDEEVYPGAAAATAGLDSAQAVGAAAAGAAVAAGAAPGTVGVAAGYADATGATATAGAYGSAAGGYVDQTGAVGAADPYGAYAMETTAPPYTGPLEFNGAGGPPTVAGTKLISAGSDDALSNVPHAPVPAPPEDYALENPPFTIYMYRAQSGSDYPMRNVNTADLAGVLWYLHNEIVAFPDPEYEIRHFNISRIVRLKVTIQNPPEFFERHQRKFGAFVAFGAGKCTVPYCDSLWKTYGPVVGCQTADPKVANYHSPWKTQPPESNCAGGCDSPIWYSLPGPCPAHEYGAKSTDCVWELPGGDCGKGNSVTGARDCTYVAEWYGQVTLDELLNFTFTDGRRASFAEFMAAGGKEYDKATDMGVYTNFWDGIHDEEAGRRRVEAVRYLFQQKYPRYPTEMQETEVLCDFDGWKNGEFAPYPAPGSGR